uniref:Uncharacterized protein n=1 Tax=Arundo donax TaxID=35708 RepID=A0A0A9HQE0_ARUDO
MHLKVKDVDPTPYDRSRTSNSSDLMEVVESCSRALCSWERNVCASSSWVKILCLFFTCMLNSAGVQRVQPLAESKGGLSRSPTPMCTHRQQASATTSLLTSPTSLSPFSSCSVKKRIKTI